MDSREKFEEFCHKNGIFQHIVAWEAWKAGRVSMRDDAVNVDFRNTIGLSNQQCYECAEEMRKQLQP